MKRRLHIWLLVALEVAGLLALATSQAYATRYRSRQTGTWTTAGTWERSDDGGVNWVNPSPTAPTSTATDTVLILSGHTVTMNGNAGNCRTLTVEGTAAWAQNRATNVGTGGVGDLVLNGGTLQGTTGTVNVQGALIVPASVTGSIQGVNITVTGATTVAGTLQFVTSLNGTKTFIGGITINNGGTWTNSINEAIVLRGGLTNNGTFTSGTGTHTFNTNSQILSGSSPITFSGIAAIAGAITVTNNGTVTVAGNLTGNNAGSTWLNAAGSILNVNAAAMATGVLNATDAPNTVNYTGAAQTVKATTFSNLFLSGSGTKTTTGVTVLDTLSRQGTAAVSAAPTYSERAVLEYLGSGPQTTGPEFPSPMSATVLINNANGVTLNAIKTVNDSIIVRTGTLSDGGFQITGDASKLLIVESGAQLQLGSAGTATAFPTNYTSVLDDASTVVYNAGVAQSISTTPAYGNLWIQGAGTKSTGASSTLTVDGTMTLQAGTLAPGVNATIVLSGDWTQNGGAFTAGSSTVEFVNTTSAQSINGSAESQTFNAITVAKSGTALSVGGSTTTLTTSALTMTSGTFNIATSTTVNGTLTLTGGTLAVGTSSLTLNSTVTGTGTSLTSGATGTVTYGQGSDGQSVHAANYGNLTFSNFNKTLPGSGTVGIAGTFTTGSATGHTITGSTIDYNGAGAQTIAPFTYLNLNVSGARGDQVVTLGAGTINVQGNLNATATSVQYIGTGNTVNFNGSAAGQTASAFTFEALSITNANGLTLSGIDTVKGVLTLGANKLVTGANRVVLTSTASVSRTSGYVFGTLEKAVATGSPTTDFEIGNASVYVPVSVAFTNVTVGGSLSASTTNGDHPSVATSGLNSARTVNRYWTLAGPGLTFDSAAVTLNFDAGDIDGGSSTAAFIVAIRNGGSWYQQDVSSALALSTTASGVTLFGDFQIGEPFTGVTYTWDHGGGTTLWSNASNWNPDGVPGASDIAVISSGDTVDIVTNRSVNTFTLNHASALFRLLTGGTLSVAGNLNQLNGTLEVRTAFPTVSGTTTISGGTVLFAGTGAQTIPALNYVNLSSSSTGSRTLAAGIVGVSGTFTPGTNSYTVTGNTFDFSSSSAQTIPAFSYNNLTNSGNGDRTLASAGTIAIAGTFTTGSGTYTTTGSTVEFNGSGSQTVPALAYNNLTSSNTGARTLASSGTIGVAGTFTPGGNGYTVTGSTVDFNGTGAQTIAAFTFNNLTISGSRGGATVTLGSGTITVGGTFTASLTNAVVDPNGNTLDFSSASSQTIPAFSYNNLTNSGNGDRTLASAGTIAIAGTFTTGSGTYTTTGSTVEFNGSGLQTIPALAYDNLTSSNTGARTLASSGTIGVAGTFTPGGNSYTVSGSTVDFNGTGAQTLTAFIFNNLTISSSRGGATVTLGSGTITVGGTFTASLTNAVVDPNGNTFDFSSSGAQTIPAFSYNNLTNSGNGNRTLASSGSVDIAGDFSSGSGTYTVTGSTLNFNGSSSQSVSAFAYNNLSVNNAAGVVMAGGSSVAGILTLTSGAVTISTDTLTIGTAGSVSRTAGWVAGPLKQYISGATPSRTYVIGDASVYAPVDVSFAGVGTAGYLAISTTSTDHPDVSNSGVSIALNANRYWTLAPNGISFTTYDATLTFDPSDVDVGADPTTFIVDQNDGGTWLLPTTGTVTSTSTQATGLMAFGDFVVGTAAASIFTSTATGGAWSVATTWVGGVVPGNNANVVIATTGGNMVTLTANPSNVRTLVINTDAILEGAGATTLNLNLATGTNLINNGTINASGVTFRLARNSTWDGTGTFNMDAIDLNTRTLTFAFSSPETVSVSAAGSPFLNAGTLVAGTSSFVRFDGTAAQTLPVASLNFNGVIIDNASGVTANGNVTSTNVSGDINAVTGQLDDGGFQVTLAANKNFVVGPGATYRTGGTTGLPTVSGTGTIQLDPTSTVVYYGSTQSITRTDYGSLVLQNVGTKTFASDTTRIAGDLAISGATADAVTNSTVLHFNGSAAQAIEGMNFHTLLFTNAGLKTLSGSASTAGLTQVASGATLRIAATGSIQFSGDIENEGFIDNEGTISVP